MISVQDVHTENADDMRWYYEHTVFEIVYVGHSHLDIDFISLHYLPILMSILQLYL